MSQMSELDLMYRDVIECIDRDSLSFSEAMTRLFYLHPDITAVQTEYLRSMIKEVCNENTC